MMYSVLLVDDEENVLEILKSTIQWKELGVERLLMAKNAQQALTVLKLNKVDLLITDIKMPGMDGIGLISLIRRQYPETRCVLLTAYGEFEYARKAIELGVENYLLKPISQEEVENTVQKAFDNIYEKRMSSRNLLRENILQRWVSGNISEEELSDRAMMLNINLYFPQYRVICIKKLKEENTHQFTSEYIELLQAQCEIYSFWDNKSRLVLIAGGKQVDMENCVRQISVLEETYNIQDSVRIAFGTSVSNVTALHLSYRFACECLEMNDLNQKTIIVKHDDISSGLLMDYMTEEVRSLLFERNKTAWENECNYLVHKLYDRIEDGSSDRMITLLLGVCARVLLTEFSLCDTIQTEVFNGNWPIQVQQTMEEFCEEAQQILFHAKKIFDRYYGNYRPIVQLAIMYARKKAEVGESGSLKEFCAKNRTNSAYLGHIFKKETGVYFNDYLKQCAINQSVVLLINPGNRIKMIAEKVGFSSVSYFVKCFRMNKGISPSQYRMEAENRRTNLETGIY